MAMMADLYQIVTAHVGLTALPALPCRMSLIFVSIINYIEPIQQAFEVWTFIEQAFLLLQLCFIKNYSFIYLTNKIQTYYKRYIVKPI